MLKQKPSTVYEVSHGLNWDFGGGDFKNFPLTQKWFAAGEAYAHLEHLFHTGKVKKELIDGQYVYQI